MPILISYDKRRTKNGEADMIIIERNRENVHTLLKGPLWNMLNMTHLL